MPTAETAGFKSNLLINSDLPVYRQSAQAPVASNFRAKAISTEEILYGAGLCMRRAESRDYFALVASIDSEVALVRRDHNVAGIEFTHTNQTQVG